jgi:type I restriction enzyme S subunit
MSSSEWKMTTLGEVCLDITDGSHTSPQSVEKGYYMASVKDMGDYGIHFENCRMISKKDYIKLVKNGCQPLYGDVLIGKDGARYLEDAFVFKQDEEVVLLSSIAILRPEKSKIISEYLYYYLTNKNTRIDIKNNYGSGSAIPRMVLKDFKKVPIPVPSIAEQNAIAVTLSCLDDKIDLNNRINKNLEEMAHAIFKSWFVDFEPFQDGEFEDSELGRIPKGWRVGKATDIFDVQSGGTPKTSNDDYWGGNIPFFTPKDSPQTYYVIETEKTITEVGLTKCNSKLYRAGTVFITARGTVGKVSMAGIDMAMNQSCYALVAKNGFTQYYVFLQTKLLIDVLRKNASGAVFDAITVATFQSLRTISPNIVLVRKFNEIVSDIFNAILNNVNQNKRLQIVSDAILPKLMSGEIRIPLEEVQ